MASILGHGAPPAPAADALLTRYAPIVAATLAAIGILAVYADTTASIVAIWWRSDTYAHGFVVIPIALWLAWRKRAQLAAVPAVPWIPALGFVAASGALWLVMSVGGVLGLTQFALAFMLQAAIVAVVGLAVARAAAFPLLFLLFAVPAGEILLPTLIDWTADFTVAALRASGVPVFREANHFIIPSGAWSVVEACSGLRYLIASVMIGVVYAAISYRSAGRRAAFIAASILVPLVANWLRAYMIVMIGHLSDNRLAVGVDHLIYGWLFFGLVMALLFWVGSFWSEPDAATPAGGDQAGRAPNVMPAWRFYAVAVAAIGVAALWRPVLATIERAESNAAPVLAPLSSSGGWTPVAAGEGAWAPSYSGFAAQSRQRFERDGASADLHVLYYRNQAKGRELVTSGNTLVSPNDFRWKEVARELAALRFDGASVTAMRSAISGARGERLVAYRLYWVDGRLTSSDYAAKALLAWSKLKGGSGDSALIVSSALEKEERDAAREALEANSPAIASMLDSARATR